MANKSVRVVLSAVTSGYESAMSRASAKTKGLADTADKLSQEKGWGHIEKAAMAASAITIGAVGAMISTYARFDEAMSQVGAATGATAEELGELRKAAMDAGAEFGQFSSIDAAGAIEELGKAGLSTSEIIGGGLRGAMALAAADGMSVAAAAELTADALMMFGKSGKDATKVADLLAQGAGAATGSAHDLGMALSQVGAVANSMGLSVEDTTTSLALFAANGIKGSDAGTSLKTMLMSLANPSKKAALEMEKLGINAFNAEGNFVGMRDLSGQLESKLSDLTTEQRNASLAIMFGSDAMRVASILTVKGAEGYDAIAKSMEGFGSAADMAAKRTDNLKGDLAEFGGAWENLMISMGEAGDGPLRSLMQSLTGFVEMLGRNKGATQLIAGIAGGLVAMGATAVVVVRVATALREVHAAVASLKIMQSAVTSTETLAVAMKSLKGSAGGAAIALGAIAAGLAILAVLPDADVTSTEEYARALDGVAKSAPGAAKELDKLVSSGIDNWGYKSSDQIHNLTDAFKGLENTGWLAKHTGQLGKAIGELGKSFGLPTDVDTRWTTLVENVQNMDSALSGMDAEKQAGAFSHVARSAGEAGLSADKLAASMPKTMEAMRKAAADVGVFDLSAQQLVEWMGGKVPAAVSAGGNAAREAGKNVSGLTDATKVAAEAAAQAAADLKDLRDGYMNVANAALALSGTQMGVQAAIDDATKSLKENGKTLDINTEKGRANRSALDNIASSALSLVEAQTANNATAEELGKTMTTNREAFVKTAQAMGMSKTEAEALATSYGLVPKDVSTKFSAPGAPQSKKEADDLKAALKALPSVTETTVLAPGARPSKAEVDAFIGSVKGIPADKLTAIRTIANLQGVNAAKQALADLQNKTVYVRTVYSEGVGASGNAGTGKNNARATGGPVWGPGTSTSDSIPAWLSAGEFVIRTEAARRIGYANLSQANRTGRLPGYATGGRVAPNYAPNYSASAVTIAAPSGPMQISGTLDLGDGLTGRIVGVLSDATTASNRRRAY
ncbi:Putative phage tail tape measure protein TMP [Mycobacteroides abscessus subsp. abscessus]|nr:Putative phage tail tape measure protein TMP [Mycobacteroides abscessus subsp. abscessus]